MGMDQFFQRREVGFINSIKGGEMIDKSIIEAIKDVVDYLYEDEANDYEQNNFRETNLDSSVLEASAINDPEGIHIFCSVVKLKKFLEEQKVV